MPDPRQKLYSALSSKFDLGTFDEFNSKMNNPESRKKLYNSVSSNFDLGSYDEFESKIAPVKKKDGTKPNSTSTSVSQKQDSVQKSGSSGSQEFEYKPVYDERGREVKIKNEKGELVPYMEKVPKGFASSTEEREIVRQEQKQKASKPIITSSNLKKYQEATKVNEEEKASLQQEVNDEFDKKGFWNGISDGAKKGFNFLADTFTAIGTFGTETEASKNFKMETDSFAKEKKQAEQELIASKQPVTPEAIAEKAKEIKLKKKIDGLVVDKNNKFLSNLSEEEIKSLNLERVKQYKTLSDKDKYIATQSEILKNNFERDTKDYTTAVAIIKKNKEKGIETNQSLIDFAIEKENSLKEKLTQVKELEAEYISNKENIGSAEEEVDFLKRNYDTADKIKTLAKIGFGDIYNSLSNKLPLMVDDLDQAIFEPLRPGSSEGVLSDDERQQLIDNSIDWENAKELAKSKVKKDVDFENLSLSNFGQFFAQEIGTQLPIFAQMAMPGGIVSIGMSSTFDKYGKMEQESNNIAFEFNGKQFNGFEKENGEIVDSLGNTYDPKEVNITSIREADKSTANKFLTSVTFGTAEAVLGAMPTKNIFGRALSSFSTSGERTLFRQSVKEFVKAKGTSVLNDTATEVVSEGATQIIQNIADISSGNKNIGIYDGVDHAAVSAGMLSFFMSASPAVAGLALKPFSESKENKQVNENLQEIFALQSQLNNTEISDISKTTIQNRINELEKANSEVLDKIASRTKGISKETFDAIKDVNKKQELLILQASEISKDNSLDKEVKKKIIADLESQFNNLETKRNKLASGKSTILDALSDNESTRLKENAANLLVNEEKAKGKTDEEINFTEEEINKKAIEIYNQNTVQQEATITETKQEAQPQAEIQKTEQEVLETPIVENETAPSQVDNVDGNVQPGNNVVEPSGTTEQENNPAGDLQAANNVRNVEVKREIRIADKGQVYTVEKTDLGLVITDKKGKKPSKVTERKILDEYSKTINFTQGQRVDDSFESSEETYIDDIASKSQNASEIAEAIAYVENADMNEGKVDPIQIAIAQALGEKAVEKSSFTNINDRNNITQSIALQYFAPSGKGKGLDQIAMEVEYEIYGDYNANNPRISEEDIANFMVDNPRGSLEFLNRNRNEALEKLRTAFTDVTGLPAKPQFIEAAINQNTAFKNEIFNGNSLYLYSDEDLLSLQNQREEFEKSIKDGNQSENKQTTNEIAEGINNQPDNKDGKQTPGIQEDSGSKNSRESNESGSGSKSSMVGERTTSERIYRTTEASNSGGSTGAILSIEEREELEARGINPDWDKSKFNQTLRENAKKNGVWLDYSYLDGKKQQHDHKKDNTTENDVYLNSDGKTLTKLNNLAFVLNGEHSTNLNAFMDRIQAHNELFPHIAYTIKGFMDNKLGNVSIVLEQPFVENASNASQSEINDYLQQNGFELSGPRDWSNGNKVWTNGIYEIYDARPANVLKTEDNILHFIDVVPHSIAYLNSKPEVTPEEKQIQNNKKDEFDNTDLEDDTKAQAQGFFNGSKQNERDLALSDNGPVKLRFPFQKTFKRVWANTFKSNSGLSKESGEVVRYRNRILATYTDHINQEAIAFNKIIKDVKKLFPKEFNKKLIEINNYLSGDKNADISFLNQEQIDKIDYFRDRIDSLSKSLITLLEDKMSSMKNKQAIESTKELIETIKQNMGIYITRNYQIFSDDNYRDMITGDFENINKEGQLRIRNAINYLIREEGLTKDEATKSVAEYLAEIRRKKNDFFVQSSGNAVSNFFKKRKGIPKEFRELLGESKDPTYNYINTVYKISQYLGNIEYQYNLREHLINNQIASLEPKLGYEKIVGSSEGWRILNDIYVPVEFKEAFDDMQPLQTIESGFYKTWIKIAGIVKINKTVLSPTTAARNLLSGVFLGANSGHFFLLKPSSAANAWNQAWSTKKTQKELFNERQKLIKLGVLGDGVNSGELMALLNDFSKEVDRMINKNAFELFFEKAKQLYAFGDDFYKVSGFYIERDRLIKSGLSELEAENKAAYRINNGYPTYSYLPKNIQRLRRLPLIGTFVSFPYETIRSTKNNIYFIKEDLEEGRTKMAYQRAAGMIVANATLGGLNMLTMAMFGLTDDDDNAIRDMLPEWQKNSKLIYLGTKNDKPTFIDGTALFPSEVIFKPISILLEKRKGREFEDKLKIATNEVLSPYISKDISFKTLTEIFENENEFNEKIYLSDNLLEGVFNESEKILNYLMRQAGPGVYNNVTEFLRANEIKPNFFGDKFSAYGKEYTNQEALLGLLGFRISTLNYNAAMSSYAYQVKQSETEDKSSSNKLVKTSKKLTNDEIKVIVEDYAKYHNENYKQLVNIVSSGKKLGMSDMEIKKSLKLSKISDNDIRDLLKGKVPRLSPMSTQTKSNFKQKLKINYKGKDINEILKNFESNFRKMNIEIRQYNRTKIE